MAIANQSKETADTGKPAAPPDAPEKKVKSGKKHRVTIHKSGDSEEDKSDVILVHNYDQIQIQRDREVLIPEKFLEVLKHATIDTTSTNNAGETTGGKIPRYSYTVEPE